MANESKSVIAVSKQVVSETGIWLQKCFNCKYEKLSVNVPTCVDCMKEHAPGNRFPLWEAEDERKETK